MNILAAIVGYLVIAAAAMMIIAAALSWIVAIDDKRFDRAKTAAASAIADRLFQDAYWFSEDVPTMKLLQRIATDHLTHGRSDVGSVRDEWQKWKSASVNGPALCSEPEQKENYGQV